MSSYAMQAAACNPPGAAGYRATVRLLRKLQFENQLELDFTPRRQRWTALDDTPEPTRCWPTWFLRKLHFVLLQEAEEYLRLAWISPGRVSNEGILDRLAWIRESAQRGFSFDECCRLSGLNPETVRTGILTRFQRRLGQTAEVSA